MLAPVILAGCVLPALAETDEGLPGEFSANVSFTTNYLYRGITQSNDGPAIQGGFDYAVDRFYAGIWGSSVEWTDTSLEVDYYAGFTPEYKMFAFDIGVLYYSYPDAPDEPEQNFVELYAGASTTIEEKVEVGFTVAFSPEFYGETGQAFYPSFDVSVPLGEYFSVGGHYGYKSFSDDPADGGAEDYSEWNISATASYEGFDFTVGYSDTSEEAGDENDTFFASIGRSF